MDKPSPHEFQEMKRKQREEEQRVLDQQRNRNNARKKMIKYVIIALVLIGAAYGLSLVWQPSYSKGEVHWHALVEITICGEKRDLPRSDGTETVHGKHFRGIPLLHTHDDNTIHIEGVVRKKEEIALGRFFDVIGVPFSSTEIMDKKEGDVCPGSSTPGKVTMTINGVPNTEFMDYVPKPIEDARAQMIGIRFE
jgi:hypothetical protein